jgi:hypothetical protein
MPQFVGKRLSVALAESGEKLLRKTRMGFSGCGRLWIYPLYTVLVDAR